MYVVIMQPLINVERGSQLDTGRKISRWLIASNMHQQQRHRESHQQEREPEMLLIHRFARRSKVVIVSSSNDCNLRGIFVTLTSRYSFMLLTGATGCAANVMLRGYQDCQRAIKPFPSSCYPTAVPCLFILDSDIKLHLDPQTAPSTLD